nr:hypothetical protein BaRGS_004776 [Batillaria attramentaria]
MTYSSTSQSAPRSNCYSFDCPPSDLRAEFVQYPGSRIYGNNLLNVDGLTLDGCKSLCVSDDAFRSIDYREGVISKTGQREKRQHKYLAHAGIPENRILN